MAEYRAYLIGSDGHFYDAFPLTCANDAEAIEMAKLLALDIRFASETWSHGRFCGTIVQHAAMAIDHGLADYVVCVAAFRNSLFTRHGTTTFPGFAENFREGGGPCRGRVLDQASTTVFQPQCMDAD
jgi:acetyl-CoA acetyltransferase